MSRRILLTNDDGIDSPAVAPFATALTGLGEVRVCVPDRERSWIGKAITRTGEVTLTRVAGDGAAVWTCSGYPADATQLGIHAVWEEPPDLVVSGINLGFNHGAAFLLSSGTVGAAIEGWISGRRAVAFSTGVLDAYADWRADAESPAARERWRALAETCVTILGDIEAAGLFDHADVVSVNLPFDATPETPRRVTGIARVGYDRLFRATPTGTYRHAFGRLVEFDDDLAGTDVGVARQGGVSITPVRLPHAGDVPAEVRRRVER